ncbi:MAG: hypothetical protein KatS3mg101_0647 [Patescibacteria group bacterium]|nr:MAG: hypothetical protein KatS3mg101_0647 [Patescibacteria group bacterium]
MQFSKDTSVKTQITILIIIVMGLLIIFTKPRNNTSSEGTNQAMPKGSSAQSTSPITPVSIIMLI